MNSATILLLLVTLVLLKPTISIGQRSGLQGDILLHPADAFTAYTLERNEIVYNQSPFTLPLPSWAWWGVNDRITVEIDLLPLLGGLFQEPFLPVPSFNFRFRLLQADGLRPAVAYETMYQHLWRAQNQADEDNLRVERQGGNSWYNHLNFSWTLREHLYFHASAGITYTENLLIENKDSLNYRGRFFKRTINPDLSLSIDWRYKPWLSLHFTSSYGTTFVYLDNIPRKYQLSYGFRTAPFYKSRYAFLRNFRAEFIGFYMYFPDSGTALESVLPVFPYFYWQWTF